MIGEPMVEERRRIPTMATLRARPLGARRVVSFFSGCGGSSLGYRLAGFRVCWANEFIASAAETYRANFPDVVLDPRDIRAIQADEVLRAAGANVGDLDLVDGSPPCASFSTSGKRSGHWGQARAYSETVQRTDDLFDEFARLVDGLRPRVFVAENVRGLVSGVSIGRFKQYLGAFAALGYHVAAQVLDAQWLGVPQHRERLFFVGVRNDLDRSPAFPAPWRAAVSLRAALEGVDPTVEPEANIERFKIGALYAGLRRGKEIRHGKGIRGGSYWNLSRPRWSRPCPTLTATAAQPGAASVVHPEEPRKFSVAEARRICGFPDDFILCGSYSQRIERLGRAVPPPVTAALGTAIRRRVFEDEVPDWWETA